MVFLRKVFELDFFVPKLTLSAVASLLIQKLTQDIITIRVQGT